MLEAVDELPLVDFSVSPVVDPNAFRLAINVLSLVARAIGVDLNALAIADVVLPLALVEPPVVVEHDALAKPFVVDDFPKVNAFLETLELGLLRMKEVIDVNCDVHGLILSEQLHKQLHLPSILNLFREDVRISPLITDKVL